MSWKTTLYEIIVKQKQKKRFWGMGFDGFFKTKEGCNFI